MITIEFKLTLDRQDQLKIDRWLHTLKRAWNRGLALLEWRQHYQRLDKCLSVENAEQWGFGEIAPVPIRYIKAGNEWAMVCDIAARFRIDRTKSWDKDNIVWVPLKVWKDANGGWQCAERLLAGRRS